MRCIDQDRRMHSSEEMEVEIPKRRKSQKNLTQGRNLRIQRRGRKGGPKGMKVIGVIRCFDRGLARFTSMTEEMSNIMDGRNCDDPGPEAPQGSLDDT